MYDVHFPENPFSDIVQEIENADIDIALGGIQMIQDQLALQQCFLSNDDITAILYYFNDDFRSNMALQVSRNTFHAINFKKNRTSAETACKAFNRCYYPGSGTGTIFRGDVMTDCRDKFNNWYNVGIQQTSRLQQVQNAQLGQDKFWNWSSAYAEEDSPFDLLCAVVYIFHELINSQPLNITKSQDHIVYTDGVLIDDADHLLFQVDH